MERSAPRLPRFRRDQEAIRPMLLTERDLEIVRHVARHRFLRSTHISQLVGNSPIQVNRRLKALYHHGYLERPRAQLDYYHRGGSSPVVYGLASRGAALIRREFDLPFRKMDWSEKNRKVGRLFLEHALQVSDFRVSLEITCRFTDGVRLLTESDIEPRKGPQSDKLPFQWAVNMRGKNQSVIPDAVFGLEVVCESGSQKRHWFFLEADRGTMPVVRKNMDQTSIAKKLRAYEATWEQAVHKTDIGIDRFRVLFVTTSLARSQSILAAMRSLKRGHGLFLVTEHTAVTGGCDVLNHVWHSAQSPNSIGQLLE